MWVGYWEGIFGRVEDFGAEGVIPKGAVAAPSLGGPEAGLGQHRGVGGVGWDEMVLKVLPTSNNL